MLDRLKQEIEAIENEGKELAASVEKAKQVISTAEQRSAVLQATHERISKIVNELENALQQQPAGDPNQAAQPQY